MQCVYSTKYAAQRHTCTSHGHVIDRAPILLASGASRQGHNVDDLQCRCGAGCPHDTTEGKDDNAICVGGPGLEDLRLVGSPPQNDLALPDYEVGNVGVARGEECGVELAGVNNTVFHGVKDVMHDIPVGKPDRSPNPPPHAQDLVPRWPHILIWGPRETVDGRHRHRSCQIPAR